MEEEIFKSLRLRPNLVNISDELLKDLIADSIADVKEYVRYSEDEELPSRLKSVVKDLVVPKCNTLGAEGLSSQSSNGISENYHQGIPDSIKIKLNHYRRLRR